MSFTIPIMKLWKNRCSTKIKIITPIIFMGVLLVFWFYPRNQMPTSPMQPKIVETQTLQWMPVQQTVRLIGTIRPKHNTPLSAKFSGSLDILLSSGQSVKKGDLIAKIMNVDIDQNYQLSLATETLAKTQYQRLQELQKVGAVSLREVDEKKQTWLEAQKELAKAKIELDNLRFYAPFDGIIGAFKAKEGTQVREGDLVVNVYDPASLMVEVDIPCTNLTSVEKNQPVYVLKQRYKLSHIQNMIDDDTHMCPADIDIHCQHCLIGSAVTVELVVKEKQQALVIPAQALFLKQGKPYIYKVKDNKTELTAVKLGIQDKDKLEIIAGLNPGDEIIIKNPERLSPGLNVSLSPNTKKG